MKPGIYFLFWLCLGYAGTVYSQPDWLIDEFPYTAQIQEAGNQILLSNGLIRRSFCTSPNGATIAFDNLMTGESLLRGIKPEAEVQIEGKTWAVGGLKGQPNYAYLDPDWIANLEVDSNSLQFIRYEIGVPKAPFEWKQVRHHAKGATWPPKGVSLRMDYAAPAWAEGSAAHLGVSIHYELYDGIPLLAKWITVSNQGRQSFVLEKFSSEILAIVEYGSIVDARDVNVPLPNLHVETDYAFSSMDVQDANYHAVHWETDPDYHTQVSYKKETPCLLRVSPEIGPGQLIGSANQFQSFRSFILAYDSYDRERQGLAIRRMYRKLAPWTTENPLMMHARFADWERVKLAIDQAAEVGFEMVILTFGSGFNIEDESQEYLDKMKGYADYAHEKGLELGGYSLLASRKISPETDVVVREGEKPVFHNSPCLGSDWASEYFRKLYQFYEYTGFNLLEHDGSYPGDYCLSEQHAGHQGYEDSRWNQYQRISAFYRWCRTKGIYLNIPDFYYMTGGNKCGMGYREVNWSLPRSQQVIHTRQNIYDGTWKKGVTMGWMFVPLTEYHGGGEAATIEPLEEHLDHYERMMVSNLGAGVQACYRGPRLYDSQKTKEMVQSTIDWYKSHREVLEGELIHLRRADGRDLDYWLMVNPKGKEKAALMVFNPLDKAVEKTLKIPLYYSGLDQKTMVKEKGEESKEYILNRDYSIELPVSVPAGKWAAYFFE